MTAPVLELEGVARHFREADGSELFVLDGVDLTVRPGDTVSVSGRSGSGKSTLLHLAAGIELPSAGVVRLQGRDLGGLSDRERSRLRGRSVGLIFQAFHLVPYLSVRENVLLPARIAGLEGVPDSSRRVGSEADRLLRAVGLEKRRREPARTLSGGEMQRTAIARALVLRPPLLLADEPTGNLDGASAAAVSDLLFGLAEEEGAGLLLATHDRALAGRCRTRHRLEGGLLLPAGPDRGALPAA